MVNCLIDGDEEQIIEILRILNRTKLYVISTKKNSFAARLLELKENHQYSNDELTCSFELFGIKEFKWRYSTEDYLKFMSPEGESWTKEDFEEKELKKYDLDDILQNIRPINEHASEDISSTLLKFEQELGSVFKHLGGLNFWVF